jgi:hypothetical protein
MMDPTVRKKPRRTVKTMRTKALRDNKGERTVLHVSDVSLSLEALLAWTDTT